jgi:RNA polymerase sigma-70 factor (ECF subfamily)
MAASSHTQGIAELLARARRGDPAAENALFERLSARILALAKRRVRDEEAARDLAQETMKTVFEKYRTTEFPHGLLPWVFTVLRNKVGNYWKRRAVEGRHRVTLDERWLSEVAGDGPGADRVAADLRRELEAALTQASAECRKVFRLLLGGAGRHEIRAAFGGEPLGTIDSRISRCRRKLLERIERPRRG